MTDILWVAIVTQMVMGAFDSLYHHEGTERLAWKPSQRRELTLHGVRNLAYAVLFSALGWCEPRGAWAIALLALLAGELIITLWDFVEEDRTRHLPASERVTHTLLTLNYGVVLSLLVPWLLGLAGQASAIAPRSYGVVSWLCALAALGVILFGLRDLAAARRSTRLRDADPATLAGALPAHQSLLVTGGTGFIGTRLVEALVAGGHAVTVLTRDCAAAAPITRHGAVRLVTTLDAITDDARFDAIVNLAGEPISSGVWTAAKRKSIVTSRLSVTADLLRLMTRLESKPGVFVSGSAIGWYGLRGDEPLAEDAGGTPCFSRRLCVSWERAARRAERLGVRTVLLRTGLVLDRSGGMLARLLTPFEFGLGGRLGNGRQWMSWIHRDDLVRLICHALAQPAIAGPLNAVAPGAVTNRGFTAALGRALSRPAILPVPAWPMQRLLGGFAEELLLGGQHIVPETALRSGFRFTYPALPGALAAITGRAALADQTAERVGSRVVSFTCSSTA